MRKNILFLGLSLSILTLSLVNNNHFSNIPSRDTKVVVELKDLYGNDTENRKDLKQDFILNLNNNIGLNYRIESSYLNCANVLVLSINSNDYSAIEKMPYVEHLSIHQEYQVSSFDPFGKEAIAPDKNYSRLEMNVPDYKKDGEGTMIAIIDDSFLITHEMYRDLDSGYKYSKDDLSKIKSTNGFIARNAGYLNNKIPFYYSYGSNDNNLSFVNNSNFHGNHVAGISAANNTFKGIAPNSQLALMKATNSRGNFTDSGIFGALDDAVLLNVDAINMSFGSPLNDYDFDSKMVSVFNKIKEKGISIVSAAGNDGKESDNKYGTGPYQNYYSGVSETGILGPFASSEDATTVGALNLKNNIMIESSISTLSGTTFRVRDNLISHNYKNSDGTNGVLDLDREYPFHSLVSGNKETEIFDYLMIDDLGKIDAYKNINVKGKIAVVERGEISFVEKIRNASINGAIGILIYNNEGNEPVGYFNIDDLESKYYIPSGYVTSNIKNLLEKEVKKKLVVGKELMGDYSSEGGLSNLSIKPDISAPGSDVYSGTGPSKDSYKFYNGTSMAAPNYTGAVANVLSNYNSSNDLELLAYKKTINSRMMSNAMPIKQTNGAFYSPRLIGAGLPNIDNTINNQVYLKGNVKDKAKIELKNNDDIKQGKVNLDVGFVNESKSSKTYQATLYVQAPQFEKGTDSYYSEIKDGLFITNKDVLLAQNTVNVTVEPGESTMNFSLTIDEKNKEYLSHFVNGTYIEGYVVFDSLSDELDLSLPYLGFYGDYGEEMAVEDFDFEKENKEMMYGSDLLNSYLKHNYKLNNVDYSSQIITSNDALTKSEITTIKYNTNSLKEYGDPIVINDNKLVFGVNGYSTHVYIQQFVNRSVKNNSIALINKDNKIVFESAFENIYSPINRGNRHGLTKSSITDNSLNGGYLAEKAFVEFSLVNEKEELLYPEGDYTLVATYELAAPGITQTKTYDVKIQKSLPNKSPIFSGSEEIKIGGVDTLRVNFKGSKLRNVLLDKKTYEFVNNDTNNYVDIPFRNIKNNRIFLELEDVFGNTTKFLYYVNTEKLGSFGIISNELKGDEILNISIKKLIDISMDGGNYYAYFINLINNSGNIILSEPYQFVFTVLDGYLANSEKIMLYNLNSDGTIGSSVDYTLKENKVITNSISTSIIVNYMDKNTSSSGSNINLSMIIGLSISGGIFVLFGIGTILYFLKNHKKIR